MFNFKKYEIENFGLVRLPEIILTPEERVKFKVDESISNFEFLKKIAQTAFNEKVGKKANLQEYNDRLEMELNLVEELSFTDYFLLVWRCIDKAVEFGAFIDYGRGSCVASLIFYCLGVTGVDPVEKKLIFSRFLSKVRAKKKVINGVTYIDGSLAPDVDLNVSLARPKIVEWLKQIYPGKICKITTISTLTGKILVKDVYKTIKEDVKEEEAKAVANLIEKKSGIIQDIKDSYESSKDFKKWADNNPAAYKVSLKLRDLIRQKSCHASGYVISYYPLEGLVPLELNKDKELTVGYDMNDISNFVIKLDLLGLISNEIIKKILTLIPEKLEDIELDENPIVYNQFQNNDLKPYGLYQFSGDCAYGVLNKIKPKNIFEASDVNAIARPGALSFLESYVLGNVDCPHPAFKDVLKTTRNLCLYQEQSSKMAVALGFTDEEGEIIRRIIGKKKVEEVKLWKDKIYKKAEQNGFSKEVADLFWKIVEDSSKYQFNLSHSMATAYLGALTVYLKYKYPQQFFLSCLHYVNEFQKPTEEISAINQELHHFKIKLLAPDILKSDIKASIEGPDIRFGLGQVKGISEKTIDKLNKFKNEYSNKFQVFHGANEAGIDIRVLNALIKSGAVASGTNTRSRVVLEAQTYNILTDKEKRYVLENGHKYDFDLFKVMPALMTEIKDEKGKPIIKDSRFETIKKKYEPFKQIYLINKKNEKLTNWFFEHEMLGFSHSTSITDIYKEKIDDIITINDVKKEDNDQNVRFCGKVLEVLATMSKKAKAYMKIKIEDDTGTIDCLMFGDKINDHDDINGGRVKEGDLVIVQGRKKSDAVFANAIATQKGIVTEIGKAEPTLTKT